MKTYIAIIKADEPRDFSVEADNPEQAVKKLREQQPILFNKWEDEQIKRELLEL